MFPLSLHNFAVLRAMDRPVPCTTLRFLSRLVSFIVQVRTGMSYMTGGLSILPTGQKQPPTYPYSQCIYTGALFFIKVTCVHVQKCVSSRIRSVGFSSLKLTFLCGDLRYNCMKCISNFNVISQIKIQTRN
jgi:hypothetical protein